MWVYISGFRYIHMYASYELSIVLCMHMHVCMYACMHVCMCACVHVCMYACMQVCIGMYVCM